jgi:catechol 2,3-dioxygenase-like lactoylglutathione lyase family enzyme
MYKSLITGLNHITLAVTNIDKSFKFYHEVLGFKPLCKWKKGAYFLVGELWFCLNMDSNRIPNGCYTHYAFSVDEVTLPLIKQKLIEAGIEIFKETVVEGMSIYFLDPDGHKIELHIGGYKTRIEAKKINPGIWEEVEFYV